MLIAALLASPAAALTAHQSGPLADLGVGVGFGGAPVPADGVPSSRPLTAVSPEAALSLGWWWGVYDDQYAFGRYWAVVANGHADWRRDALVITPTVEVRRGLELIVVGLYGGLGGGAVLGPEGAPGWTARASAGAKLRRTRFFGLSLRLEAGVDAIGDTMGFGGAALLGGSFARPAHQITAPSS